jgi:hypothetical protein
MGPTLISLSLGFKDRSEVPQDMSATRLKAVFVNRTVDIAEGPTVEVAEYFSDRERRCNPSRVSAWCGILATYWGGFDDQSQGTASCGIR